MGVLPKARYAGSLTDKHIRAVARLALRVVGVRPDSDALSAAVHAERLLARRLVEQIIPTRLPALAAALGRQRAEGRPALTERLPGMLALGWRQVHILRAPGSAGEEKPELGLLGATFNAAIAVYDHLLDEPDRNRPMPSGAADKLASLVIDLLRNPRASVSPPKIGSDADWSLLIALVCAWAEVAASVLTVGQTNVWPALAEVIGSLLAAENQLATGCAETEDQDGLARLVSVGPARALGLMAELDAPPVGIAKACRDAAAYLGEVMWLSDDLADLVTDARRGHPNTVLGDGLGELIAEPALYHKVALGAERLAACLTRPAPPGLKHFAREVTFRWLQWDQHPARAIRHGHSKHEITRAVKFLLRRQAVSYEGDEHRLTFPRDRADGIGLETQSGLTFLRATVLHVFLEADEAGLAVPDKVLAAEGLALLHAKHPLTPGGWSYLPDFTDLPPDTDDLAQVLRALHRLGGSTLASTCDEGVRLALDAAGPLAEVPTWILPLLTRGAQDHRMRRCVELVGGGGSHHDVVANLLLALAESNPIRYREPLNRGAQLLASRQSEDGSWPSAWYAGSYYCTALAVSVLLHVGGFDEALDRARTFVLRRQGPAGGWMDESREVLATAQALLVLNALNQPSDDIIRRRGAQRLEELQDPDGGWPAEPWIRFPTRDGSHTYGSRTATTAWALKALLAADRIERMAGA